MAGVPPVAAASRRTSSGKISVCPAGVPPVAAASRPACRRWQWPPGVHSQERFPSVRPGCPRWQRPAVRGALGGNGLPAYVLGKDFRLSGRGAPGGSGLPAYVLGKDFRLPGRGAPGGSGLPAGVPPVAVASRRTFSEKISVCPERLLSLGEVLPRLAGAGKRRRTLTSLFR